MCVEGDVELPQLNRLTPANGVKLHHIVTTVVVVVVDILVALRVNKEKVLLESTTVYKPKYISSMI